MSYLNIIYVLGFLPVVIILYNIVPKKVRPVLLLIASLAFFFYISKYLLIFLLLSALSIYLGGILMQRVDVKWQNVLESTPKEERKIVKEKIKKKKRIILTLVILFNISFLFYFKYLNFFKSITNSLLDIFHFNYNFKLIKHLSPIGISFYTLQALSYLIDVYNGKIEASKNILKVMLYLSFFPTIMEGPITRFSEVSESLYAGDKVTYHNFCFGYQRIIYGLFKKYVIADRLNIFVKLTFSNYLAYSGPILFLGALFYTILLYMEFSGTMDVVIGSGEIFNINIPENFKAPFFSKNISEFWSRWHISLGHWFKDYIFYPVSLSKGVKKLTSKIRKLGKVGPRLASLLMGAIALFCVWSLNGLWHGAGYTFLLFGYYHFVLILLGNIFEPLIAKTCEKLKINRQSTIYKGVIILKTIILVIFGELIFRAPSVAVAFGMIHKIFTNFTFNGFTKEIFTLGLDYKDYIIVFLAVIFVLVMSILKEKGINVIEKISKKNIVLRWLLYYALILGTIIFGAYGPGYAPVDPIYADF